ISHVRFVAVLIREVQSLLPVIRLPGKAEVEYYHEYAAALSDAGPAHVKDALEVLDQGIGKIGLVPTLQLHAIDLEVARKEYSSALKRLDTLAGGAGRKESWLERRGDILRQAGEEKQALQAYESALGLVNSLPVRIRGRKATVDLERRLETKIRALKGSA
ncbi:MAG: tetratricopeptide repeat protein, partial [Chthoniobacteraceae bacterium]